MIDRIIHTPRRYTESEWGGTETVVREICRVQRRMRFRPEIVTSKALDANAYEEFEGIPIRRFNYCYPFLGLSKTDKLAMDKKGGNMLSLSLFLYLTRRSEVRIFHAHAVNRLGGMVRAAARLRRKPYVVSLHGGFYDVPAEELEGMRAPVAGKFEWGKVFGALFGSRRVLDDAQRILCVGAAEYEKMVAMHGADRVAYLPNGVHAEKFSAADGARFRKAYGIAPDAFLVTCLSRIDAQKNQLTLVDAFSILKQAVPSACLALIGPVTSKDYLDRIEARVIELGLRGAVTIIPGIANESNELGDAFRACDVFALPSIHEPFGIVALEAWTVERPLIASRVGGLKRVVRDGDTGLFFDPAGERAAEDLADRLKRLAADPAERERLGRSGRREAVEEYSWESIGRALEGIYQSVGAAPAEDK